MQKIQTSKLLKQLEWLSENSPNKEYHVLLAPTYDIVSCVKSKIDSKIDSFNFSIIKLDNTLYALVARKRGDLWKLKQDFY